MKLVTLDNGLKVIIDNVNHINSFSAGIFIKMGSKHERNDELGITHFIEHMLLKSNLYKSNNSIQLFFDNIGAELNAFTTKEYICIFSRCLADHAEEVIHELINMIKFPLFNKEEIESEKEIVYKEISQYKNNHYELSKRNLTKITLNGHPLSRDILGNRETISTFDNEKLLQYYYRWLDNKNIVISLSGKINKSVIERVMNLDFPNSNTASETKIDKINFFPGKKVEKKKNISHSYISMAYPGLELQNSKLIYLYIINCILSVGYSSVLYNQLRNNNSLVYAIQSSPLVYNEGGIVTINTSTLTDYVELLPEVIDNTLKRKINSGITNDEVKKSIAILKTNFTIGIEDSKQRMLHLGKNLILDANKNNDISEYFKMLDNIDSDILNDLFIEHFSVIPSISIVSS